MRCDMDKYNLFGQDRFCVSEKKVVLWEQSWWEGIEPLGYVLSVDIDHVRNSPSTCSLSGFYLIRRNPWIMVRCLNFILNVNLKHFSKTPVRHIDQTHITHATRASLPSHLSCSQELFQWNIKGLICRKGQKKSMKSNLGKFLRKFNFNFLQCKKLAYFCKFWTFLSL